jgi:hypothetical protein
MILSRILMILALAVLAYLVFLIMSSQENFKSDMKQNKNSKNKSDNLQNGTPKKKEQFNNNTGCNVNPQPEIHHIVQSPKQDNFVAASENIVYNQEKPNVEQKISYDETPKNNIKYEKFADVGGIADTVNGAAPFGGKPEMDEGDFAKVSYTGMVDGTPGDVIQIEGTDLLTAPLVDNMLYTNSIANTNRNASQDLRGDIPLQFNETYTPFYSSVIYGAPLSQKQMTIGNI